MTSSKVTKRKFYFLVPQNSVFRFYFNTHNSPMKIRYTLMDDEQQVIGQSEDKKFVRKDIVTDLLYQSELKQQEDNPYTL